MSTNATKSMSLKQRAARETKEFLVIALFLSVLLGAVTAYRRVLMAEVGVPYLHYGYAIFEALVLSKIILIGEVFHLADRWADRPLIVVALYKSVIYWLLALAFYVLEHVIRALLNGASPLAEVAGERGEILAYTLVVFVAFIPFFSLQQAGRLLGGESFLYVLLRRPRAGSAPA